ncbi:MAG: tetratricopeptide repeat protein, partial [Kiritimatiellia bacterium]|nr:tetratricopeptide repeat protein [Kiritimatiellia bacterium]
LEKGIDQNALLEKARKLCEALQWRGIDLWFGRSVIVLANIELARGDLDAAGTLIRSYLDVLNQIEASLTEQGQGTALSPLAGARFLLGEISRKQAEQIEAKDKEKARDLYGDALRQFVNVFARYADSDLGPEAGLQSEQIQAKLRSMGYKVEINLGVHAAKVAEARFKLADEMFVRKDYEKAAKTYLEILGRYDVTRDLPRVLSNLLMAYVELDRPLDLKAVAEHIAERHAKLPEAGIALLRAGKHYFDADKPEMYTYFYDLFIRGFPKHERAPSIAFTLAGLLQKNGDPEGYQRYLDLLIRNYKGDPFYYRAISAQAWSRYSAQQFAEAAEMFKPVVENSPPSHERGLAQFTYADCLVRTEKYAEAVREFQTLQQWLASEKDNPYGSTSAEIAKNRELLEKAVFFSGFSLSRVQATGAVLTQVRTEATRMLDGFVKTYPNSDLASRAMSLIGQMQIELGQAAAAAKTFDDLARRYPTTDEGRNARFSLIRAAVEIGKLDVAREAFGRMMAERDAYPMEQLVRVAQWMLDSDLHEDALRGFEAVWAGQPADKAIIERTLFGLGKSSFELGQFDKAALHLTQLLKDYPLTGLFFDAQFTLARAHAAADRLPEAIAALDEVFKRADTPLRQNIANIERARIQKRLADRIDKAGQAEAARTQYLAAVASYQRIAMFYDPKDPAIRALAEEAILQSIELFMKLERYTDAMESCDQYLRDFADSDKLAEVRRARADANMKAGLQRSAPPRAPGG